MTITHDDHTGERPDSPTESGEHWFSRLGRFSVRRRRLVMIVWLVVVLGAAPLAITVTSSLSGAGWEAQGSVAQAVRDELRADFPQVGAEAAVVVVRQSVSIADDPAAVRTVVESLGGSEGVASVVDPLSMPPEAGLVSPDGLTALVPVALSAQDDADLPISAGRVIEPRSTGRS